MKVQKQVRRVFEMLEVRNLLSINPVLTQPYTPDEVRTAYGLDNISFGPAGSTTYAEGQGETIGIIEDSGDDKYLVNSSDKTATTLYPITYSHSDMALFEQNLSSSFLLGFRVVGPDGTAASRPSWKADPVGTSGDKEIAMEVEWAQAMAPLANIVLIESEGDLDESVTVGAAAAGCDVVIMSELDNDQGFGGSGDQILPGLPYTAFQQPNIAFVAASGNSGTPVAGPSDYPTVIDVASSDLTLNDDELNLGSPGFPFFFDTASYNSETGWSNPKTGASFDEGGSGGGYTLFPSSEAPYQSGLKISDGNQTLSNFNERVTPDISFMGGSTTGLESNAVEVYSQGHLTTSGGTGLSAAGIAAMIAIADEGARYGGFDALTNTPFGQYGALSTAQVQSVLYKLPTYDFHDITSGFNGYSAGAGYDLVSGLGTPVANELVPDLARSAASVETTSPAFGNVVYATMNYEAPEVYASTAATTAIPNNMTLQLSGTMIDIYDNSTGSPGLGTLVAADPLATTSQININGGDYASNTLTINFATGNMIPAGGLYFDGTSYGATFFGATNTASITGTPSLIIEGQLPAGSANASATGVWNNETVRPLSPTAGFITLGGTSTINYSSFATPTATSPAIIDTTPANDVSYIALGSNSDYVTLNQGPIINGIQSTQYISTGLAGQLFTRVDFINKTGVTVADADGNDTVFVNFNNGNPLPLAGITFNGGTGINTINITGNHNFTLGANGLTDTTLGGGALSVLNEQNFELYGGAGNNIFTVTGWLGTGTIHGNGGQDTVEVEKSANMGVSNNYVGSSDGMLIDTVGIAATVLEGVGTGSYSYTVNSWGASNGALWLNGFSGGNTYNIGTPQTENLDVLKQMININARGSNNSLILFDQKNTSFVNYTLSSAGVSSVLQTIQGGGKRPFAGVTVKSGALSSETLNANAFGSSFFVTPSATTAYKVVGFSSLTPSANELFLANINSPAFASSQSPTLFNTNSTGTTGIFMFSQDKGIQFSNMVTFAPTNYVGSVGAVNAVTATAGSVSLPNLQIINSVTGQTLQTLNGVYPTGYSGGVQVAIGDVNGDGIPDIVVAPGVGAAPVVKIYSVLTGLLEYSFVAQSSTYNFGLQVAVGDVTGDGKPDIITAPLVGAANVNVFVNSGSTTTPFAAYSASTPTITAFSTISGYQGGVGGLAIGNLTANVATAKDPGGVGDIIVGSGIGTKAIAQVFNYSANGASSTPALTITPTFSATVTGGVSVAVADVNGDGVPDLVMGAGGGGGSLIDVWSGKTKTISNQFTAFTGAGNTAPVHVAIAKISAGVNDILAAQGINGQSHQLKTFTASGAAVDTVMENNAYLSGGINLG